MRRTMWSMAALLAGLAACSSHDDDGSGGHAQASSSVSTGTGGAAPVEFGTCPEGYADECAVLSMPLDHANPAGESIDFHIARRRATSPTTRQVWLLAGGPGQAGEIFTSLLDDFAKRMPDADFYVVDHRGTGYSHRLTCPQQDKHNTNGGYVLDPSSATACLSALDASGDRDRLPYFTTRQAAADVVDAIERLRSPDQKVFVWGGSYGTHWAHRVLQLAPSSIDGFVFDGFMTPNHFGFVDYDKGVEEAGEAFAADCDANADCASRMGGPALETIQQTFAKLETTPCGAFTADLARTWVSLLLGGAGDRMLAMPLVHRLQRCNAADQAATLFMAQAYNTAAQGSGGQKELFLNSGVLQYNIALSELWTYPGGPTPTAEELDAAADAQTFLVSESYPGSVADLRATWPLPPADATDLPVPVVTSTPLLWLAGSLDSRTPPSQANAIASLYPDQPFVMLEGAVHIPSLGSPLASNPKDWCGLHVISAFVEGDGAVDTSCETDLLPVIFSASTAEFAMKWWNTTDDWGDGITADAATHGSALQASDVGKTSPEVARVVAELHRRMQAEN